MAIHKDARLQGEWQLSRRDDSPRYVINVTTTFPNYSNEMYLASLIYLGFRITKMDLKSMDVVLPDGWNHIKIGKEKSIIIDRWGSERITIDYKSHTYNFKTRYGHELEFVRSSTPEIQSRAILNLMDFKTGTVIDSTYLDVAEYEKALQEANVPYTDILDEVVKHSPYVAKSRLDELISGWDDIALYWDV